MKEISANSFIWLFENHSEEELKYKLSKIKKNYILYQIKENKIINEYKSIKDAYEKTNIKHISDVVNGKRKTAGGYIWKRIFI